MNDTAKPEAADNPESSTVEQERQLLADAQAQGAVPTLFAWIRLSGPGWLQSAITLGGGSLTGALFLGILGGPSMLWLQLVAIIMGVIMLSAISYVTLSTRERPFAAINRHINPALGWGWLLATVMANIIWCMPQFSLCYEALDKNLIPGGLSVQAPADPQAEGEEPSWIAQKAPKFGVSAVLLIAAGGVVILNRQRGLAAKVFDWFLKGLVGMVVICFFGVVAYLSFSGAIDWGEALMGFIPSIGQWNHPTGDVEGLVAGLPEASRIYWEDQIVGQQRAVMIGAAATAVGINMTFLMPYSMLHRGWDKPFRGLASFDLATGMAIPYLLVTTCVVLAAATAYHAKAPDEAFLSDDPAVLATSSNYGPVKDLMAGGLAVNLGPLAFEELSEDEKLDAIEEHTNVQRKLYAAATSEEKQVIDAKAAAGYWLADFSSQPAEQQAAILATMSKEERLVASSLKKRNAFDLSKALAPLVGDNVAKYIFGIGVFGMGFSTIIILMLINGFAFCEALGLPDKGPMFVVGCLVAGAFGASWPLFWDAEGTKLWLAIITSSFGMMLLPIAYITFFMMMNSKTLLGDAKPEGTSMIIWNVLMGFSVLGAIVAAAAAIYEKASHPVAGPVVIGIGVVFVIAVIVGFVLKPKVSAPPSK